MQEVEKKEVFKVFLNKKGEKNLIAKFIFLVKDFLQN